MAIEVTNEDIATAALQPAEMEGNAGKVKQRSIDELIKAANRSAAIAATSNPIRGGWGGLRGARVVPPGTNGPASDGTDI